MRFVSAHAVVVFTCLFVMFRIKRIAAMEKEMHAFEEVTPDELCRFIGLLIARVLCPQKRNMKDHWRLETLGAIPAGTFGSVMSRRRFEQIKSFLHFTDGKHKNAKVDRAWKVRSIVTTLQETFAKGFNLGRWCAFDEMVIPSRSSYNRVRVYMKNKPHKYGTKLFALCDSQTAYCKRIEGKLMSIFYQDLVQSI